MATDPRLLQMQQRNIENASALLLRKRQFDQELESRAKEAELQGVMSLLRQKDLPIETRTDLANKALMQLRVPQTSTGAMQGREELMQRRAIMEDLTKTGFKGAQNVNPEDAKQFLEVATGERPLEGVKPTLSPEAEQSVAAEKALKEKRDISSLVDLEQVKTERKRQQKINADIAKVNKEISSVGKDDKKTVTALNLALDDMEKEARKTIQESTAEDGTIKPKETIRVAQANIILRKVTNTRQRLLNKLERETLGKPLRSMSTDELLKKLSAAGR